MKRISAYLARELMPASLVVMGFALFLLSLVNMFQAVDLLVSSSARVTGIAYYWLLLNAYLLSHAIPLAVMVSTIIVFCRFAQDLELVAIKSSGIHLVRVALPVLSIGLAASLLSFGVTGFLQPAARYEARNFRHSARAGPGPGALRPGSIVTDFPGLVIFVPTARSGRDTVIYQRGESSVRMASARRATLKRAPEGFLLGLEKGFIQVYDPREPEKQEKVLFAHYNLFLPGLERPEAPPEPRISEKGFLRLLAEDGRAARVEAMSRLAYSLAPLFLMITAIPLGIILHRSGAGVLAACLVVLGYVMSLAALEDWLPARSGAGLDFLLMLPNASLLLTGLGLARLVR